MLIKPRCHLHKLIVVLQRVCQGTRNPFLDILIISLLPPKIRDAVMKWAENNPVVSAFGIWNSDSGRRTIKFMQGINLCNTSNLEENYGGGIFNDWNDRESVVTIGSNGNYNGGVGGNNHTFRNPNFPKPRRRKQPLPDDDDSSDVNSGINIPSRPSYGKPALEWDVFLDPSLVRQVDAAMDVVENLELKLRKTRIRRQRRMQAAEAARRATERKNKIGNRRDDDGDGGDAEDDEDFDALQSHTAAQVEVDRLVAQLMRRTIIAHGSMSQLVLEAMGVAPTYNFGTVVRSSREDSAPGRKSARRVLLQAGNTGLSLGMSQTDSWDEEEERRDFEGLLDPSMAGVGGTKDHPGGPGGGRRRTAATATASSSAASKGMFMEAWLHVFAQTLTLLAKSGDSCSQGENGSDNHVLSKKGSSASSSSSNGRGGGRGEHLFNTKARPANIGQRGLSGLLEKMFLRRDSSFPVPPNESDSKVADGSLASVENNEGHDGSSARDDDDDDAPDPDDDSALLTNNDMFSPQTPNGVASRSSLGALCGVSLCLGMGSSSDRRRGRGYEKGETSHFPLDPHASHKMAQDIERIAGLLGEPLRLVLDLKSRRVPPRVWSRLIDSLRTRGLVVEGIGSFDMDELRMISRSCSYTLVPLLFFHSVGDLQRACHANEVSGFT